MIPKIVQINFSQNIGSTGKIAEQIGEMVISKGWESYIVSGRQMCDSKSQSIRVNNKLELFTHIFFSHFADMDGRCSYFATKRLVKKLIKIKPDIVHLHVIHESFINYSVLFNYLKDADIPVVWTFHDCWSLTGHCAHFDYRGCEKWKDLCFDCPVQKNLKKLELFNRCTSNHRLKQYYFSSIKDLTIVPVSEWLEGLVRQSFLADKKILTIKNGIDLSIFKPSDSNLREKLSVNGRFFVLGCAGTWGKMKGIDDFGLLAQRHPDWFFVMVGLPLSQHSILPSNIYAVPFTNGQKELAEYYSAADVFLNPTLQDTYPTTNLEALACGTPVVTYKTGGSPETIDDRCGISVPRGDIDALECALVEIQSKGKDYYSLSCTNRADALFDKQQRFQEYINLYIHLLNDQKI